MFMVIQHFMNTFKHFTHSFVCAGAGGFRSIVSNFLNCFIIMSSTSSHAIAFTFGLMPFGKVWTSLSPSAIGSIVSNLATLVEGDPKAPFSMATTLRCKGGRYFFRWIAPLYP